MRICRKIENSNMGNTDKIDELINCMSSCDKDAYTKKIQELGLTKEDFKEHIHFSDKKYIRTCITRNDEFELILLCWSKGQKTAIHNHDGNECFVYALDGEFKEVGYALNKETNEMKKQGFIILKENELAYTKEDSTGFHTIENINDGTSLSLHLYRNPIESCLVYNEEKQELATKHLAYDFV